MFGGIDIHSSLPVYVQIENNIRFAVASGRLRAGDRLPSIRELSKTLRLNPNTVAKAYRDLTVMGYLYTQRGMGVFISKGVEAKCREQCRKKLVGRLYEVVAEAKAAGMSATEVKGIVSDCLKLDSQPYGETPAEILALAKKK